MLAKYMKSSFQESDLNAIIVQCYLAIDKQNE